jgi:hypothetical protein
LLFLRRLLHQMIKIEALIHINCVSSFLCRLLDQIDSASTAKQFARYCHKSATAADMFQSSAACSAEYIARRVGVIAAHG